MPSVHWHVLGAGAIGSLLAARLRDAGCPVTLLARTASSPAVRLVIEAGGDTRTLNLPVSSAADGDPVHHLLVTTKAYDVSTAVASIAHRLTPTSEILVLVNGMGFAEELATACPGVAPYFGTTTEGAYRSRPNHIHHAGQGTTLIGRFGQQEPPTWFGEWQRSLPDCRWEPGIEMALWQKLAINCAINPLTAVHNCRNGELLSQSNLRTQVDLLCHEIAEVSEAVGYLPIARELRDSVDKVIRGTASNYSSMLQDMRAGRRTEIDYITGYLLQVARRHGIDTPVNRALLKEVSRLAISA